MTVIDSDAHIVECDETWSYLDPADRQYRPVRVAETDANGEPKEYWHIDGNIFPAGRPGLTQARVGPHPDKVATPDESASEFPISSSETWLTSRWHGKHTTFEYKRLAYGVGATGR